MVIIKIGKITFSKQTALLVGLILVILLIEVFLLFRPAYYSSVKFVFLRTTIISAITYLCISGKMTTLLISRTLRHYSYRCRH